MVQITTESRRTLTATRDHKVLTESGWSTLGHAIDNHSRLTLEGVSRNKPKGWTPESSKGVEIWHPVCRWERLYEVSNQGRVRRIGKDPKRSVLAKSGYPVVSLNRPSTLTHPRIQELQLVHRLVLEAFVGPPAEGQEACHLNHNRQDPRLENLRWGSSKSNKRDMLDVDRQQRLVPVFEHIISVEDKGLLPSYDLCVEGPYHNFIANGMVVHNSYNEMSGRYTPLPDLNYLPTTPRLMCGAGTPNKQAGTISGAAQMTEQTAEDFQIDLLNHYRRTEEMYQRYLGLGVPKELARIHLPVARYSRMRASANLRNWLAFLTLRDDSKAQFEIQEFAREVAKLIEEHYPRTYALYVAQKSA